jgi:hypothetical protein
LGNSTQLRFLESNDPDKLTKAVGLLPFRVEIKSILPHGKGFVCFFTILDENKLITNELIKKLNI